MAEIEPYKPGLVRNHGLVEQLKELQRNPKSLVFVALAESYRKEGLPQQALEILEEGMTFHPGLASAVLCKSRCLFDMRRYAEALSETQWAIRSNPQNLRAHKLQAEIYARLGQRKAAMRALTHVVSLYPQDVEAVRALEELENLESKLKAPIQKISRASVDRAPPAGRIEDFTVGTIGHSLASIGAVAEFETNPSKLSAKEELAIDEVIVAPSPRSAPEPEDDSEPTFATRTIAELYLRQGLKVKATKVVRKILKEDPSNMWARETLQDLESDGIVLPAKPPQAPKRTQPLEKQARALEIMLARIRLMKRIGA